ncbi:MAG: hypothetical protein IT303_14945 [Dehalococcoidia bacterium]|nr:hypothetical protein [Dehalococcoidia bacterium]
MSRRVAGGAALAVVIMSALLAGWSQARADEEASVEVETASTAGLPGFDISWPQCGGYYPEAPVPFGIIGLNGGRPFTANPCFVEQYQWAGQFETNPAIYINVAYPRLSQTEGATGPYGTCVEGDEWCRAYNFGYAIGRDTMERVAALGIRPSRYWLDVETENYWLDSDHAHYNAQVIRGTVEYFRERAIPIGIYSTPYQWGVIAGNAAHGVPVWTAGADDLEDAKTRCGNPRYAFAGGQVVLVQYIANNFDNNWVCTAGHEVPEPVKPASPSVREDLAGRALAASAGRLGLWQVFPIIAGR